MFDFPKRDFVFGKTFFRALLLQKKTVRTGGRSKRNNTLTLIKIKGHEVILKELKELKNSLNEQTKTAKVGYTKKRCK